MQGICNGLTATPLPFAASSFPSHPEAMVGLRSRGFRRRLYLLGSLTIIGLQGLVYLALVALWRTRTLDHHLFSLSRIGSITRTTSVISQALIVSSLAALTFFAQALASDRIVRRRVYFEKTVLFQKSDHLFADLL